MTFLFGLLLLANGSILAKNPQPTTDKHTSQTPTLTEIAKANDAAWEAIKSVDMVYDLMSQIVTNGKKGRQIRSTDIHWSKEGIRERLRRCFRQAELKDGDFGPTDICEYEDYFLDGKTAWHLRDSDPTNKDKGELSCSDQKGLYADICPETPRMLAAMEKSPELLRYKKFGPNEQPLTLSEIVASWKVSLKDKQITDAGDTLWLIHAEYPPKNSNDELAGSYMDIHVNADKGFLIQKVLCYANNAASKAGRRVGVYYSEEVKEFQDCSHGIYFPRRVECRLIGTAEQISSEDGFYITQTTTKLSVNSPLPDDADDFQFPKNMVVQQASLENKPVKFLLWGPDNKPAKEFNTGEEFNKFAEKEEFERLGQRVEKNLSSKKPSDLVERGEFLMHMKNFNAAIAAFSEVIAVAPKSEEGSQALAGRGMTYLLYKQDFGKAIADFTEIIQLASKEKDDDVTMVYYLRGLAYASQKDGLDKACADMTEVLRLDPNVQESLAGAYLVRSVAHTRKNNLDEALTDATKAIQVDPKNADAYAVRCYIYEKKGDQDKAIADRKASERLRGEAPNSNDIEAAFAVALHHCLTQLLPALE
jgi:tetratricopeptide (TPR) repeat protein